MALSGKDRQDILAELRTKLQAGSTTLPLNLIEEINTAIRTKFPGRLFCLAARINQGALELYIDDVLVATRNLT